MECYYCHELIDTGVIILGKPICDRCEDKSLDNGGYMRSLSDTSGQLVISQSLPNEQGGRLLLQGLSTQNTQPVPRSVCNCPVCLPRQVREEEITSLTKEITSLTKEIDYYGQAKAARDRLVAAGLIR